MSILRLVTTGPLLASAVAFASLTACGGDSSTSATDNGSGMGGSDDGGSDVGGGGMGGSDSGTGGATTGGGGSDAGGTGGTGGAEPTQEAQVCILNSCQDDGDCTACTFGRNLCDTTTSKCIACRTDDDCDGGEACTEFGTCAPESKACPVDGAGEPTITCASNDDCGGCAADRQICDTASGACVGCTETNTSLCAPTDICLAGKCSPRCPSDCSADADCGACAVGSKPATACNDGTCAECSDTFRCRDASKTCIDGACVDFCGDPAKGAGLCQTEADCAACGQSGDAWDCKLATVGGGSGKCVPPPQGCDLGFTQVVIPEPWNAATQLCQDDTGCDNQSLDFNVGGLLRDTLGIDSIDLGITELEVKDATVSYTMNKCANVEIGNDGLGLSCGACVPCETNVDCNPISLTSLAGDLFSDDPLAGIALRFALDLIFPGETDPAFHFQCLPVVAGYGVCAPCSDPTKPCGQ